MEEKGEKKGAVRVRAGDEEEKKAEGKAKGGEATQERAMVMAPGSGSNFLEDFGVSLENPDASDFNPDAPSPRGAHSAVLIGDRVYVFGGYGGSGYARRDFNDLFVYDAVNFAWVKLAPAAVTGELPAPRSGHVAVQIKQRMLVYGGWSNTESFNDMWSLDTDTLAWSQVESGRFGHARWNHAAVSVDTVPYWQVFLFGGSSSEEALAESAKEKGGEGGGFMGDTLILDTGKMTWTDLGAQVAELDPAPAGEPHAAAPLPGDAPRPRADTAMIYDAERKRVIVFGGWANRWYNDAAALTLSPVVGPPYCVLGVEPTLGPITGGTPVKITGMGFEPGTTATIRFTYGRKFVKAVGKAVSDTLVEVESPSFEHIAPGTVDVRVSLKGGLLSITSQPFSFFLVTDSKNCYAFGPALLKSQPVNTPTSFIIQSRDTSNAERLTGGDEYAVTVWQLPEDATPAAARGPIEKLKGATQLDGAATIVDLGNGRYTATYMATTPGLYRVDVEFKGTFEGPNHATKGLVRGSPFIAEFVNADAAPKDATKNTGSVLMEYVDKALIDYGSSLASATLAGVTTHTDPDTKLDTLLHVKNNLTTIASESDDMRLRLDVAAGVLAQMKRDQGNNAKLGRDIASMHTRLEKANVTWDEARKEAPRCKLAIGPLVKTFSAKTRKDIEKFEADTREYVKKCEEVPAFWRIESGATEAVAALDASVKEHAAYMNNVEKMATMASTFEFPQLLDETNRMCKTVIEDVEEMRRAWALKVEMDTFDAASRSTLWKDVMPDKLEETAKGIQKRLKTGGSRKTRSCPMFKSFDKNIRDFLSTMPLVGSLRHKSMRPRHWALLAKATKKEFTPPHEDPNLKLQGLLDLQLHEFAADVEEITDQAMKEEKMEEYLVKLKETWSAVVFLSDPYKPGSDVQLLKLGEEDFESLEADQLGVQGMMASRYLATFEVEVTAWFKELGTVADLLILLTDIQRKWAYLEPLFIGSDEVRRELPEDAKRFEGLDASVKTILKEMHATSNVKAACNKSGLIKDSEAVLSGLDLCEKSLSDFLAGKQRQFPRFYFVSKTDLLDILSNGSTPKKIMQHITKVFLQTDTLYLDESSGDRPTAIGWKSGVGVEDVVFNPTVKLEGKVESYLQTVTTAQEETLKNLLIASLMRRPTAKRVDWLIARGEDKKPLDPAQLSLLVSGMEYVNNVESGFEAIAAGKPDGLEETFKLAVDDLSDLVRLTQTNLSKADRTRVMCMITLDAHGRDIIQKMIVEGVTEKKAFQWQSQLKARMVDKVAKIVVADAVFDYSFEYLGNGPRLVITPLTDRIYVTATQALNLKMGCAPAGPAGTGKTESTKDLANALAITCYVFNCRCVPRPRDLVQRASEVTL